jgi:predicted HicB family RNase H-like nuclease
MKHTPEKPDRKQLGVRIDHALTVEAKILALRTGQGLNDLVEEAIRDLLKKYKGKS